MRAHQWTALGALLLGVTLVGAAARTPTPASTMRQATCETDRILYPSHPAPSGRDVVELQRRLKQLGMYAGVVDGVYGESTWEAVSELQRRYGMKPDGITGHETWFAMGADETETASSGAADATPPAKPVTIQIDTDRATLTVLSKGKPFWRFAVAIGEADTPSPIGEWRIADKGVHWGGGFGTRWLGLDVPWGIYGIHGTNKPWTIGTRASHGCFRMHNASAEVLYRWVTVGTPVVVTTARRRTSPTRTMRVGATGKDVVTVQLSLRRAGFDAGRADGRFGKGSAAAVRSLHVAFGLPSTGDATDDTYILLKMTDAAGGGREQ